MITDNIMRLFVNQPLVVELEVVLSKESAHYLLNVLRLRVGTDIIVFNGGGGEYTARLVAATKKTALLQVIEFKAIERESPLPLTLVQAISRSDRMDYTIQKAVELGVHQIVPVITARSPPLDKSKISKREQHWQKIIISSCEQCGRNRLPVLEPILPLSAWLMKVDKGGRGVVLSPTGTIHFQSLEQSEGPVTVLIGAEGGLSETEIEQARQAGYLEISLGSRILRTETAAVAVLAICQALWGDLG
ncbi:MAG TPA: 16S rRNA (uracil(1498)-N(3))-methyltransferase [Gammaproteobacteria bacterium]|nr:16S rRNA (uracil(1498)-N(3))-methyltransferase [Gammaproteobacteria bacterium]